MSTVLESITKKIEELGIGQVTEYQLGNETNDCSVVELLDPRDYKEYFRLDDLGIAKNLKSCVIEVKDSECKIYYLLDSSLISITLRCKWQPIEVIKELPIATIAFFRYLTIRKAPIELNIYEDKIHIIFQDTNPKLQPVIIEQNLIETVVLDKDISFESTIPKKRQKKDKPIAKKYSLEILLSDLDNLDKAVLDFTESLDKYDFQLIYFQSQEELDLFKLPITLKDLNFNSVFYVKRVTQNGEFRETIVNRGFDYVLKIIECPILVGKNYESYENLNIKESVDEEILNSNDELLLEDEEMNND